MSDFRAIAGVSATLRTLLQDRMELPARMDVPPISIGTPLAPKEQQPEALQPEAPRVNLFLFQVSENPHLKNRELPGRGSPLAYGKPPLSLELNFLLTAYGSQINGERAIDETVAQALLGSAMRVLHDYPVITGQLQTVRNPYGRKILHESLRDADEQVKLCLDPISLEDLTKIWTALTLPYRLSVAYSISVVQIESRATRRYPKLVGEQPEAGPRIVSVPLERPGIDSLQVIRAGESLERSTPYTRIDDTLVIYGRNFRRVTEVDISGLRIPVEPVSNTRIEVTVPDKTIRETTIPEVQRLQPGPHSVEVLSEFTELETFRLRSNRTQFMLVPLISSISKAPPRQLSIKGARLYQADSSMQTLVGYALFDSDAYNSASSTKIEITLPDVLPQKNVAVFVSNEITNLDDWDSAPQITIKIVADDTNPAHTLTFRLKPSTLDEVVTELENRIRNVDPTAQTFVGARVTRLGDRLVIMAGGGGEQVTFESGESDGATSITGLQEGRNRIGYLSGRLVPLPVLSQPEPKLKVTIGSQTFDVTLDAKAVGEIVSRADIATVLEKGLREGSTDAFKEAQVTLLGEQLLILPGGSGDSTITFEPAPDDDTTVQEWHLRREYAVRVRVNGAESVGGVGSVELPL